MIAAKMGDPVLGLDIHAVVLPPPAPPAPTPLPHPFVGVVFDPMGAAIGAGMAKLSGGGPVFVNSMPTGNTGTGVKGIPHFPTPPGVCTRSPGRSMSSMSRGVGSVVRAGAEDAVQVRPILALA